MGGNTKFHRLPIGALGDRKFFLSGPRHPIFINGPDHHAGPVLFRQLQHLQKTLFPIFIVSGVQDALTAHHLETRFHLGPLGGIQHQRQGHVGYQSGRQLLHILFPVAPHIIHVDIQDVGPFFHLGFRQGNQAIPIFLIQQPATFFGTTGIQPLPND